MNSQGGALSKPQGEGVQGQHSNGNTHSDPDAQQVHTDELVAGGAGSSTDSTQSSPRRDPRLPSLPHDPQQQQQQQQRHPEISHASPQAHSFEDGRPAPGAASFAESSKGASRAPANEDPSNPKPHVLSNSNFSSSPRPRPGRRRTSSEERRLSGQSPHSMWEHMPIASVPEFQVAARAALSMSVAPGGLCQVLEGLRGVRV